MNKETTGTGYTTSREKLGRPKPREISSQPARRPERTDRAQAMVANAYACQGTGMKWLNHSPVHGVPMLTAKEWTTAVHFAMDVDQPDFKEFARRRTVCGCCSKKPSDAASWTAHALNGKMARHGVRPSGLHPRIASVVNTNALESGVASSLGGDSTQC